MGRSICITKIHQWTRINVIDALMRTHSLNSYVVGNIYTIFRDVSTSGFSQVIDGRAPRSMNIYVCAIMLDRDRCGTSIRAQNRLNLPNLTGGLKNRPLYCIFHHISSENSLKGPFLDGPIDLHHQNTSVDAY